jgi:hypothetical protein
MRPSGLTASVEIDHAVEHRAPDTIRRPAQDAPSVDTVEAVASTASGRISAIWASHVGIIQDPRAHCRQPTGTSQRTMNATTLTLLLLAGAGAAGAQPVRGTVVSAGDGEPVPYATVLGPDTLGRFADANGRFSLGNLSAGTYRIRARMLGYAPLDIDVVVDSSRTPVRLRLSPIALHLATVPVTARNNKRCVATGLPADLATPLGRVYDQLRTNVDRYHLLRDRYPFSVRREEILFVHFGSPDADDSQDSTTAIDTVLYDSRERRRYQVGTITYTESTPTGRRRMLMYLPTFADLTDSAFLATHCFEYGGDRTGEIRIDFRPADKISDPDVAGSVYLDDTRYIVRRAEFRMTKPDRVRPPIIGLTVTTTFKELVPSVPILDKTEGEQPLTSIRRLLDPSATTTTVVARAMREHDRIIDHTFIADTIGAEPTVQLAPPSPPQPVTIRLGCALPTSFETIDLPVHGTLTLHGRDTRDTRALTAIRREFHLPDGVSLSVYGYPFEGAKIAPMVRGEATLQVGADHHLKAVAIEATSLSPAVDSTLVTSIRRADSTGGFLGTPQGRYTLSMSTTTPEPGVTAVDLAHVSVPIMRLSHQVSIESDSPVPFLPPGNGSFEFVVDEQGHPIPSTLRVLSTSSPSFAEAVGRSVDDLRYTPAKTGNCAIKAVILQPLQATARLERR